MLGVARPLGGCLASFSSGASPIFTSTVFSPWSRQTFIFASWPGWARPTVRCRSAGASTFLPSNSIRMSPDLRPALAAGLSGTTSEISTPFVSLALNERASSWVRGWIDTPSQPRVTRPLLLISL